MSTGTKPELAVRRRAHALGLRYRVNTRPIRDLRRTADMVFSRAKIAVFIDGCYWHGCPEHFSQPSVNEAYWESKIGGNVRRDLDTNAHLTAEGWLVLRYWEHMDPEEVVGQIYAAVRGSGGATGEDGRRRG